MFVFGFCESSLCPLCHCNMFLLVPYLIPPLLVCPLQPLFYLNFFTLSLFPREIFLEFSQPNWLASPAPAPAPFISPLPRWVSIPLFIDNLFLDTLVKKVSQTTKCHVLGLMWKETRHLHKIWWICSSIPVGRLVLERWPLQDRNSLAFCQVIRT